MIIIYPRPHTSALTDAAVNCSQAVITLHARGMTAEASSVYDRRTEIFRAAEFAHRDSIRRTVRGEL